MEGAEQSKVCDYRLGCCSFYKDTAPLGLFCGVVAFSIKIPPRWGYAFAHWCLFSTVCVCVSNSEKNQKCFENRASGSRILSKL